MNIVPESSYNDTVSSIKFGEASLHAPALQDVLRTQEGPQNIASKLNNRHPLEQRVQNWDKTQQETRFETYRRIFGAGEPIRRTMELSIVENSSYKPQILGGVDSMSRDILTGRDATVDWEDVYKGDSSVDMHSEMEKTLIQ